MISAHEYPNTANLIEIADMMILNRPLGWSICAGMPLFNLLPSALLPVLPVESGDAGEDHTDRPANPSPAPESEPAVPAGADSPPPPPAEDAAAADDQQRPDGGEQNTPEGRDEKKKKRKKKIMVSSQLLSYEIRFVACFNRTY